MTAVQISITSAAAGLGFFFTLATLAPTRKTERGHLRQALFAFLASVLVTIFVILILEWSS